MLKKNPLIFHLSGHNPTHSVDWWIGVESCLCLICRYSVKNLLDHEFFAEIVKFELLDEDEKEGSIENHILTMRMEVPTKETPKTNKVQESIEFVYDLQKDDPAEIVKEMVNLIALNSDVTRSIRE